MNQVDLHTHTTASDGTYKPRESVLRAKEKGLAAIGITDHDTVAGIKEALIEGKALGIRIVPGIEISSVDQGQDIHVLGYYMDLDDQSFLDRLQALRQVRDKRNEMIIENLNKLAIPITVEEVLAKKQMREGNIGRPHIAEVLMDKGVVSSIQEAFAEYLGKDAKAYANPPRISPEEAIDLIKAAGGVPVLAHPGLYHAEHLVVRLIHYGLEGIEVFHTDHTPEQEEAYSKLAKQYGLIATAGSDFHGERNGTIFHGDIGTRTVSLEVVEQLKEKSSRR